MMDNPEKSKEELNVGSSLYPEKCQVSRSYPVNRLGEDIVDIIYPVNMVGQDTIHISYPIHKLQDNQGKILEQIAASPHKVSNNESDKARE